jgi:hypothetical protein
MLVSKTNSLGEILGLSVDIADFYSMSASHPELNALARILPAPEVGSWHEVGLYPTPLFW